MAGEGSFYTKFKDITSSLQKIVECPVCMDTIRIPFKTCSRGHGVCCCCCEELNECPTCEGPFTAENPTCLKNLLEALPRVCRYADGGCEEIVEQGNDHEKFCGYRPLTCRYPECGVKIPIIKLMGHCKAEHPNWPICTKQSMAVKWPEFDPGSSRSDHIVVSLFNNVFWLSQNNDEKNKYLKVTFQATPIGKLDYNYFARIKFEKEDFVYQFTIKASVSSSCDMEEENKATENEEHDVASDTEEYHMKIPQSVLHKFIDAEGKLHYTIFFFEEAK